MMWQGKLDRMLAAWCCLALLLGACFAGDFVMGLPCQSDADCGPQLACVDGLCGGPGDRALCGNGLLDQGEECDDGNTDEDDACTPMCRQPVCGDGFIAPGEECDDGNTADGDECTADCLRPSVCGNGVAEPGEECDDGNTEPGDTCTPQCQLPVCGDGHIAPGEECDDGNDIGTDTCTPACALPACGDGFVNLEAEICDDGNEHEFDECTTACTVSPETPTLKLSYSQVKQFEFNWAPALGAEYYELFESASTGEDFVRVDEGNIVDESIALTMPLRLRLNARYKLRACNAMRCAESAVVDVASTLAEAVGYFKASNTGLGDNFGFSVALSADGNTLAVGAHGEDSSATGIDMDMGPGQNDNTAYSAGAVYVFERTSDTWSQQAYIKASNTNTFDDFGFSVALSADGNTLAVGAPYEDSSATGVDMGMGMGQNDNTAYSAGAVYVFERIGDSWSQQAYVKASNTGASDYFGLSVALSADGNTLAVGAPYEDSSSTGVDMGMGMGQNDNTAYSAGAVYVFERIGDSWSQQAYVKASNTDADDRFGRDVALSANGNALAVGAYGEGSSATNIDMGMGPGQDDDTALSAGAVYVFERTGNSWSQDAYIKASNTDTFDIFGWSVALSANGRTLAVGAYGEHSSATGVDMGMGPGQDDNTAPSAGAAYVFERTGDTWSQQVYIKASNTDFFDQFGWSVALSATGNTLAVGANRESSNATGIDIGMGPSQSDNSISDAGAVYVFERTGGAWSQHAYVKPSNTWEYYFFGQSMVLSEDGSTLAVGARGESSNTTGIGGEQFDDTFFEAGAVYLY